MPPFVAIVVATYRRAPELRRLCASLEKVSVPLALVVVDNADDPDTEAVVKETALEAVRLLPGGNLGCGGGLAFGERAAMERYGDRLTHLWVLDDDTEIDPAAPECLIAAMAESKAGLACPMIVGDTGAIGWFPGLLERAAFDAIRVARTPAEYLSRRGGRPVSFSWATGVSLLVSREAFEALGAHRDDFWIRGEDLEFSLRYSARFPAIFVPGALVRHLPRPAAESPEALAAERIKHLAMIRNAAYISFRLTHGRRIMKNLPGNLWRYFKTWGPGSIPEALVACWHGAVAGKPAGAKKG